MHIPYIEFGIKGDERGQLVALESNKEIPFEIKRVYYLYDLNEKRRGFHAHKELRQVLICVSGECKVLLDDGITKIDVLMDNPSYGLLIDRMIWHEMYDFSDDCVLVVLASDYYNENDYIRNYSSYKDLTRKSHGKK